MSKNCWKRWYDHRNKSIHPKKEEDKNKALYRAIRKYGLNNFSFEIIEELPDASLEELKEAEKKWILFFDSYKKGYNETWGGDCVPEECVFKGESHPGHILTEKDVIDCRNRYARGERRLDVWKIYKKKYPKLTSSGFANMWFGRTWKDIMPEVFEKKQYPAQKVTREQVLDIRKKYEKEKWTMKQIVQHYKGILGYGTIYDIAHRKRYADIK